MAPVVRGTSVSTCFALLTSSLHAGKVCTSVLAFAAVSLSGCGGDVTTTTTTTTTSAACEPMMPTDPCYEGCNPDTADVCDETFCTGLGAIGCNNATCFSMGDSTNATTLAHCMSEAGEAGTPGELLLLQQLTRHGIRSPKSNYAGECPLDPYTYQWDTWNTQLTGTGDLEEAAVGEVTQHVYGEWLGLYNGSRMTVRAVDSDRVLQSAMVAMSSLFAPGTGPRQGLPNRPTFVPIHTVPESDDALLLAPPEACWSIQKADYDSWWDETGLGIFQAGQAAAAPVTAFCGAAATSNGAFKDQIDGIGFDREQAFLSNQLSDAEILAAQNLSITLQRGYFATDDARTYMAGDLPAALVSNLNQAIANDGSDKTPRYLGYFAHRHALYALAEFFGWSWKQYGIPEGQVHTATTVWIELRRGEGAGQYDVTLLQWAPHCGEPILSDCPVQPIVLPGCARQNGTLCSIEEFSTMVSQRVARTGTWQTLCSAKVVV